MACGTMRDGALRRLRCKQNKGELVLRTTTLVGHFSTTFISITPSKNKAQSPAMPLCGMFEGLSFELLHKQTDRRRAETWIENQHRQHCW